MQVDGLLGDPILADDLLFRPEHSIIDQSLHARLGGVTTNGDGFGIGWYRDGDGTAPAVFKGTHPAWNDRNLREVATQIHTPLLFAHVRASSGTPVQRSNCHPFRHGRWLWMHNGSLAGFDKVKRDLLMAVDQSLYPEIEGSTDTETLFFLALTFGLADDPPTAVARAVGLAEQVGPTARRGLPGAHDGGHQRRRVDLGLPLLQRESHEFAVLLDRHRPVASAASRAGCPRPIGNRHPLRRLGAAASTPRRVERGSGELVGARSAGRAADPAVPARGHVVSG